MVIFQIFMLVYQRVTSIKLQPNHSSTGTFGLAKSGNPRVAAVAGDEGLGMFARFDGRA